MIQTEDLSYKITYLVGKCRNSVKMLWKNIFPKLLSPWQGVDLGHVTKEQNSPVFVTGTYCCPRPAPSPKVLLLTFALDSLPCWARTCSSQSFAKQEVPVLLQALPLLKASPWGGGGAHGAHAHPWVPALCFVHSPSSRERRSGVSPPPPRLSLKFFFPSCGTQPQILKSVPKLPTSDQLVIPLNISFSDFWKDSLSTLLTGT